jgi:hypothetical protein
MATKKDSNLSITVTEIKPDTQNVGEVVQKAGSVSINESTKHFDNKIVQTINVSSKSKAALYTLVALDAQGNEKGGDFRVPSKEYEKYYSDETKFKVKKKAI